MVRTRTSRRMEVERYFHLGTQGKTSAPSTPSFSTSGNRFRCDGPSLPGVDLNGVRLQGHYPLPTSRPPVSTTRPAPPDLLRASALRPPESLNVFLDPHSPPGSVLLTWIVPHSHFIHDDFLWWYTHVCMHVCHVCAWV